MENKISIQEEFHKFQEKRNSQKIQPNLPPRFPAARYDSHPTARILQKQIEAYLDKKYAHYYSPAQKGSGSNWGMPDKDSSFWRDLETQLTKIAKECPGVIDVLSLSIKHTKHMGYIYIDLKCVLDGGRKELHWLFNPDEVKKKRSK